MSDRTFNLDEAHSLLPVLESLLRAAINGKKIMEEVESEMQALNHRIFLNGGTHVDVSEKLRIQFFVLNHFASGYRRSPPQGLHTPGVAEGLRHSGPRPVVAFGTVIITLGPAW